MSAALIGRDHPAAVLDAEIDRTATSHGGLVLVAGEAGIGKTALVTSAARRAREHGVMVLGGSCWDSAAAPGLWPWTQVMRALRRSAGPAEWAELLEVAGSEVAALLGEERGEGADGFRLYDAVTTALVAASQRRPVVVVLDDLHWADAASVRLLEFAARHTWFERLLLVGTYRDVEVEGGRPEGDGVGGGHPLRPALTALAAKATTVTLTGLERDEVGRLIHRTVGREPDPDLVAEVHRRTGGNPFFVEQTARLWHGGGSVTAIAPGVRDAVRHRLSLLAPPVVRLLTAAAVLGREFHRGVLAATADMPVPHVDRLLDQAVAARLVISLGEERFAFAHDLVRETLYGSLGEKEAREAHAEVVRALDRSPSLADHVLPAEAARHARLAGDGIDPLHAVRLLRAAAAHASSRLSLDEAASHLRHALELVPPDRPRERALLAVALGQALHHDPDPQPAWDAFDLAADLALSLDDDELLARVALSLHRHDHAKARAGRRARLLEEAHRRLIGDRAAVAGPSTLLTMAQELAAALAGLAREGGDEDALAFGLWARHDTLLGLGTAPEREELTRELADLALRTGDRGSAAYATSFGWVALLEQGDPRYLDRYREFMDLTRDDDTTVWGVASQVDTAIICTMQGRFAEAESLIATVTRDGECVPGQGFGFMALHLSWALALLRGRFEEVDALRSPLRETGHPYADLLEGVAAVQRGDIAAARRYLAEVDDAGISFPREVEALWLRFLAQTAAASGDPELCERARAALLPHRDLWGVCLWGCEVSGPMSLWLGLLDAAEGRWDDAEARLTEAYRSADRLLARPWSAEARLRLAGTLAARGGAGDADAATALLAEVADEASRLGMRHLLDRARREPAAPDGPAPAAASVDARHGGVFRRAGTVWTLTFGGRTVHMPDTKGLRDLHRLLGSPGTPIPAVALLSPEGGGAVTAARRMGGDAVLDDEAKARYERRLRVLDEEIAGAVALGDDDRAAAYDRERAALLEGLRAAAGLAGRTRRLGDEAERARKTVTARIRDTLRKLDRAHPALAGHLRSAVSTGTTCVYSPGTPTSWTL
ncbi:hypothetical protein Acsp03_05580 [Actinomadura sp. NBRC 104412]|uniref:ATP-binding protein n=1 Tax=Actinomadura sp. NBRC 104412 TaxID=3032203 RepID=UPI0024A1817E|nr:AAA family ATPase [Actinomadura sp. NBRC 104412]GLZ03091.1 hypothetical protein Acsp03_05580 [Actinomadura sp. NBRC 104412]